MGQLDGKISLVTGGSAGIGLATARRFVEEGATVYVTGRRKAELDAAVETLGGRAIGIQSDVSHLAALDELFAIIQDGSGRLDVVVANAGGAELARLGEVAATAVFLASDQSSFTTGAELFVDGGLVQV
ncbi:SDR family NAD(P)-dependent oxidoreductase [Streptomyces sp. 900105755]|uniref:SDR family NAD(P)-dependent oxidoreductase n=1 Tax=Streptomyces sp. 900105755 TaxID=3154389 RepID=UPI0033336898